MNRRFFSLFPLGLLAACRAKPGPKPPPLPPPPVLLPKITPPTSSVRQGPHNDVHIAITNGTPLTDAQIKDLCDRIAKQFRRTGIPL